MLRKLTLTLATLAIWFVLGKALLTEIARVGGPYVRLDALTGLVRR